jgi:hypothetical protein
VFFKRETAGLTGDTGTHEMKQQIIIAASAITFIALLIAFVVISEPGRHEIEGPEKFQGPEKFPGFHQMKMFDTNNDGKVSRAEWMVHFAGVFDAIDRNGDNTLDRSEIEKFNAENTGSKFLMPLPPADALLDRIDANRDGSISRAEWIGHHEQLFSELDKSGKGYLSEGELKLPGPPGAMGKEPPFHK